MKNKAYLPLLLKRLKDPKFAVTYLTEVLQHENQDAFMIALKHVLDAREQSVTGLADKTGLTRQGLYKTLSKDGNPRLSTLNHILKSLGMKIVITGDMAA